MSKNETLTTNNQNEISTDNLDKDFGPTIPLKNVAGKPMHVCGRQTWRGIASPQTSKEKIGDDGKENKFSCQTVEEFEGTVKGEKVKGNSVYITEIMYKRLDKLVADDVSIDMLFAEGKITGVLYGVKRKSMKPGGSNYWSFVTEKQLKEVDLAS